MNEAYIGLGSNLNDPMYQVQSAIRYIAGFPNTIMKTSSSLYRTKAWGKTDQEDFINAVVNIQTTLEPHALLEQLLSIETKMGRERTIKWGPRIIDCDVLLYGNLVIDSPTLQIPQSLLHVRGFVVVPLAEIAPTLRLPSGKLIVECVSECDCTGIEKL